MTRANGRKKKIQKYIETLKAGGTVSKRDMRAVLTEEQVRAYDETWNNAKDFEREKATTPDVLKDYTDILRVADGIYNNGADLKAQGVYERALERLEELLEQDQGLRIHLDRDVVFTAEHHRMPEAEDVPRLTNSRSEHCQVSLGGRRKKEHKLGALEDALDEIINVKANAQADAGVRARLKKFRNNMRNKY